MKHRRLAFAALSVVSLATVAHAQTPPRQQLQPAPRVAPVAPNTQLSAAALKIRPVVVDPNLQNALAQKKVFDPNWAQGKLTYVGDVPQLKIRNKTITLEPANQAGPTYAPLDPSLKSQLTKYQPHISARYVGKARIPNLAAVGKTVDSKEWQTPIKDQGSRGTCVAHASMAGIEQYYKKAWNLSRDLSENHAYNMFMSKIGSNCVADPGVRTVDSADWLKTDYICDESASPYVTTTTNACATIPPACASAKKHGIKGFAKFFAPAYGGTGDDIATNTSFLEALLNLGFPVVMGLHVAGSDWGDGTAESGIVDVQKNSNGQPAGSYGGHAMLLTGYNSAQNYFIFKNSWGTDAGHDGYFHLSYEYLQTYAKYGYVIIGVTNPG